MIGLLSYNNSFELKYFVLVVNSICGVWDNQVSCAIQVLKGSSCFFFVFFVLVFFFVFFLSSSVSMIFLTFHLNPYVDRICSEGSKGI